MSTCTWEEGEWTLTELNILQKGVRDLAIAMRGANKFVGFIGGVTISQNNTWGARGLTWPHRIKFTDNPVISINEWTVVHELAHAWDANYDWRLSEALESVTGGSTKGWSLWENYRMCDEYDRLPGCNLAGYFYGGIPPKGSDWGFNKKEDFAESVTAYVYPRIAKSEIEIMIRRKPQYNEYLYYPSYYTTPRWRYIDALIYEEIRIFQ